jgi:hypothetical protein
MEFKEHVGPRLLKGYYDELQEMTWPERMYNSWSEPKGFINYGGRVSGYGPLFFLLLLPAAFAGALIALLQRKWRFLLVFVLLLIPLFAIHQLSWWLRYSMFSLAMGILGLAFIDGILRMSDARHLLRYLALFLALAGCFFHFRVVDRDLERLRHYLDKGPEYWHPSQYACEGWQRRFFQKVYKYERPGTTILVDDSYKYFWAMCLWNLEFSNRVVYADIKSREAWFKRLEETGADYVIVGKDGDSFKWIRALPSDYAPLVTSDVFMFYRVRKTPTTP